MRKLVYSALALGAAMTVTFGAGAINVSAEGEETEATEAPAATLVSSTVSVDTTTANDNLVLKAGTSAKKILVGVPSFKASKDKTYATATVKSWDVYDADASTHTATVDLSKYANTKECFLMAKADLESDDKAVIIKIPASDTIKVAFDKGSRTISVKKGSGKDAPDFKSTDGSLRYYTDANTTGTIDISTAETPAYTLKEGTVNSLLKYEMSGATLYVQTVQTAVTSDNSAAAAFTYEAVKKSPVVPVYTDDTKTAQYKGITLPARPCKAAKLTIGKLANAPKIKADYVNGKITVSKGCTYTVVNNTGANVDGKTDIAVPDTVKSVDLSVGTDIEATNAFAIDVKTTAVGGTKPKAESRWGRTTFPSQTATEIGTGDDTIITGELVYTKGDYILNISNKDTENTYIAYASWGTGGNDKTGPIKIGKAKTNGPTVGKSAKITAENAAKDAFKFTVQRVGDNKGLQWAGTPVDVTKANIAVDNTGNENAEHAISVDVTGFEDLNKKLDIKIGDAEPVRADNASASKAKAGKKIVITANADGGNSIQTALGEGKIKVKETKSDKELTKKGNEYEIDTEAGTVTFTMPTTNVTIYYDK